MKGRAEWKGEGGAERRGVVGGGGERGGGGRKGETPESGLLLFRPDAAEGDNSTRVSRASVSECVLFGQLMHRQLPLFPRVAAIRHCCHRSPSSLKQTGFACDQVQCCFTSTETVRIMRGGREPGTASSTFTQLLSFVSLWSDTGFELSVALRPQRPY